MSGCGALQPRIARHDSRGQSLVEFALVFPIIILLIAGFFEIGRAVFAYNTIANAARQGARVAMVNQLADVTECDESWPIDDPYSPHWSIRGCAILAAKTLGVTTANVTVSYAPPPSTTLSCSPTLHVGCIASVTVTYAYTVATPFVNKLIGPITMTQTSQMPVERVFP
ncbi:MAG TPA: TadE/TadG family type IV pilus assembly protein [Candidatus Dormibacteraeota bacterium]|nr:TadE/TadG family type IV pilus assembly protein [Candidatus Dormibacteraeota bacterium]